MRKVYVNTISINEGACFGDYQGDTITYNYTIDPAPPSELMTMTPNDCNFTFNSLDNTFANTYTVTVHAYDQYSTEDQHYTDSFTLILSENQSPTTLGSVSALSTTTGFALNETLPPGLFSEPDSETLTYNFTVSPANSKITVDTTSLSLNVSSTTTTSDAGTYTVTLTATDGHPGNFISSLV